MMKVNLRFCRLRAQVSVASYDELTIDRCIALRFKNVYLEYKYVSKIARRVLSSAKSYSEQQRKFYEGLHNRKLAYHTLTGANGEIAKTVNVKATLEMWTTACEKLEGNWNIVVIRNATPNAFVTELCPRRIFVHTGLLEHCKPTDDELGMVLSHEISHLLLGHVSSAMETVLLTSIIQLVFLSFVDPFGILTLLLDYYSFQLANMYTAYHSRTRELEADSLGLEVASLACFDVEKGAHIFRKFGELENGPPDPEVPGTQKQQAAGWFDSHPPSDHRFALLEEASKHYKHLHGSPDCIRWQQEFEKAVELLMTPKKTTVYKETKSVFNQIIQKIKDVSSTKE